MVTTSTDNSPLKNKKLILIIGVVAILIVVGVLVSNPSQEKGSTNNNPLTSLPKIIKEAAPSETLKEYSDPSGFTFSYPDNLSLVNNKIEDDITYADIQLTSKEVSGSLSLRIVDSKYTTLDDWLKLNQGAAKEGSKEVKLGSVKASELKLNDRLLLGALDQKILFTIEVPLIEEAFWTKVYNKVLAGFTFAPPEAAAAQTQVSVSSSSEDVTFEGEEVVE